jgi:Ni,Fe-hydrogenase III large subunit
VRAALGPAAAATLRETLDAFARDLHLVNDLVRGARSVRRRLEGTGVVATDLALRLGLVGQAARASGVPIDLRASHPCPAFARRPVRVVTEPGGDCWARLLLRVGEVDASLEWLAGALGEAASGPSVAPPIVAVGALAPSTLVVSLVEGWRGEVVHCLETDARGGLVHYKVQDPSLVNWFGVAQAVRGNAISDFPLVNKSFDLSYCGHDL